MGDTYASVLRNQNGDQHLRNQIGDQQVQMASNDPLALANGDHPGAQLVAAVFNGSNFLSWMRNVKMALGAKLKLRFIDGTVVKPASDSPNNPRWMRADYMVRCWLFNSMEQRIAESFMYVTSAQELWGEILERYGQSNIPLLYRLRKEMNGSDSVGDCIH